LSGISEVYGEVGVSSSSSSRMIGGADGRRFGGGGVSPREVGVAETRCFHGRIGEGQKASRKSREDGAGAVGEKAPRKSGGVLLLAAAVEGVAVARGRLRLRGRAGVKAAGTSSSSSVISTTGAWVAIVFPASVVGFGEWGFGIRL
jgi:hypothetical protein